jgi:murein DD-endopeptidase MepM/ murein hydrolase activator NlpD
MLLFGLAGRTALAETALSGPLKQGGIITGQTLPGSRVTLDGRDVRVSDSGAFVFGFTRDFGPEARLEITGPDGSVERRTLSIASREYRIQRIDGLPPKMVTPPEEVLQRIRREIEQVKAARDFDTPEPMFLSGWQWPSIGPISGVYGSQRILNGKPRRPHFGVDVAAPVGTPVVAPADGIVRMAVDDHYYTGGTIILDHGHGLSSAFLHMDTVTVSEGQRLVRGERMGTIGATGRATGPHLDWRMNWFDQRVDPTVLVGEMPKG